MSTKKKSLFVNKSYNGPNDVNLVDTLGEKQYYGPIDFATEVGPESESDALHYGLYVSKHVPFTEKNVLDRFDEMTNDFIKDYDLDNSIFASQEFSDGGSDKQIKIEPLKIETICPTKTSSSSTNHDVILGVSPRGISFEKEPTKISSSSTNHDTSIEKEQNIRINNLNRRMKRLEKQMARIIEHQTNIIHGMNKLSTDISGMKKQITR